MKEAHDVYAETNPAFCTYALVDLIKAYSSINGEGLEFPAVFIALPIALSGDLGSTFSGTNRNTGLLEWLERYPQVGVGLADRINASKEIVSDSIRFACFSHAVKISTGARLHLGTKKLKKSPLAALDESSSSAIKRAERLGYWFAMAGSTRNIFSYMGLTI